jgi:hypothetical protein
LHAYINRIQVVRLEGQALRLIVHWRDGTADEMVLVRKGTTYTNWLNTETERLLTLVDNNAAQLEIAATFPYRTWAMIRNKHYDLRGTAIPLTGPQPIRDDETYGAFLQRTGGGAAPYRARSGERWNPKAVERLIELLEAGASQVEICAEFPHRNWKRIRAKITEVIGRDFVVPGSGEVRSFETYEMYRLRTGQARVEE